MSYEELMIKSLSDLLDDGEKLLYPVYGVLVDKKLNWFGFFGLTESKLLIALLQGNSKVVNWTTCVPLDIKKVIVKKTVILPQYVIKIEFNEGNAACLRIPKKVVGIECQEENLKGFMDYLETY